MRKVGDILQTIRMILATYCHDEILTRKWAYELAHIDDEKAYRLYAPETIDDIKWTKLYITINKCITYPTPVYEWEQKVVGVYMGYISRDEIIADIVRSEMSHSVQSELYQC
jgi:hypothetical protein